MIQLYYHNKNNPKVDQYILIHSHGYKPADLLITETEVHGEPSFVLNINTSEKKEDVTQRLKESRESLIVKYADLNPTQQKIYSALEKEEFIPIRDLPKKILIPRITIYDNCELLIGLGIFLLEHKKRGGIGRPYTYLRILRKVIKN